mgnify:CR=1 FL=1
MMGSWAGFQRTPQVMLATARQMPVPSWPARTRSAEGRASVTFKDRVKSILKAKHNRDATHWRQIDEISRPVGYLLLLR